MQQRVPEKTLLDVPGIDGCSCNACPYMRLNTLEKLKACLETLTPAIDMDETLRLKALKPMQRMNIRIDGMRRTARGAPSKELRAQAAYYQ